MANEPQTLGEHVAKCRHELGLTQEEAAQRLGVSSWTVLNWEKGKTEPPVVSIPAILRFLGYDPFPVPKTLAEELALQRSRLGWSQSHMAQMLGIDEGTWVGWETGRQVPKGKHAELIWRFLDRLPV
ncbi:helix-turn-helix domain-containing protein [Accumulibacter sp.]|uniref:helix-turn-helix domain-containing protein n=1 Tax=Accumulibacter sp. TaxID=2053492 RepID=UPI0035B2AA62